MVAAARLVTAGTIGRAHGLDGSFTVEHPAHPLVEGTVVTVAGREHRIERRAGTDRKPLVRLAGIGVRDEAQALRGELLLVQDTLGEGEWLAQDLVGCRVEGLGEVRQVVDGPSCDVLELSGGELVPLVADAVVRVDLGAGLIEIDRGFLGLDRDR